MKTTIDISARPPTDLKKAISAILLASLCNTIMIVFVKLASQYTTATFIVLIRYALTLVFILPFIYFNKAKTSPIKFLKTNRFPLHLLRDFFGFISLLSYFYITKFLPLADTTVLFNTAPLFIPFVVFFWVGVKIVHRLWWGLGIGFLGIIFILHPGKELFESFASLIGLFSGVSAAIVYVAGRFLTYTEPPLRNMFYYALVGTIAGVILILIVGVNFVYKPVLIWLLLGVGVFGYFYQHFLAYSAQYAPVRLTAAFLYSTVIFSLFCDWLIWHIIPSLFSLIGIALIIIGACLLLFLFPKDEIKSAKSS